VIAGICWKYLLRKDFQSCGFVSCGIFWTAIIDFLTTFTISSRVETDVCLYDLSTPKKRSGASLVWPFIINEISILSFLPVNIIMPQVLHQNIVLILSNTIVSMQLQVFFFDTRSFKKMVDGCICTLSRVTILIYQIIQLKWQGFTRNSKNTTFSSWLKLGWTRLLRVGGISDILCIIKTVEHYSCVWCCVTLTIHFPLFLSFFWLHFVILSLMFCSSKVSPSGFKFLQFSSDKLADWRIRVAFVW